MSASTHGQVGEPATAQEATSANGAITEAPEQGNHPPSLASASRGRKDKAPGGKTRGNARSRKFATLEANAAKFPNGPEARSLMAAEPKMPSKVKAELENASDPELLAESFKWLLSKIREYHRPSRSGKPTALYPANLVRDYQSAYGKGRSEALFIWLRDWVGYLRDFSRPLRKGGKYASNVDPLKALDIRWVPKSPFDRLDELSRRGRDGFQSMPSPPDNALSSSVVSKPSSPGQSDAAHSSALPSLPRTTPSQFEYLHGAAARNFVLTYRDDPQMEKVKQAARALASDRQAIAEIKSLGPEAEGFLIHIMQKLGIPLS